jgi:hypothetical protein
MKRGRLRRAILRASVAAGLGLSITLTLISSGAVSMAQILPLPSPTCTILDPLTGLCQTITSILNSPTPTATTTTNTPLPTVTTTTTTSIAPTTVTSGTTSTATGSTTGGTTTTGATGLTGTSAFGSGALGYGASGPGGLSFGAYGGNFGGGTTYFAPRGLNVSSRQVYFQSAFGAPISEEVAMAAVGPGIDSSPVSSAITQVPPAALAVFSAGLLLLILVTCLVLEVNEGVWGRAVTARTRAG